MKSLQDYNAILAEAIEQLDMPAEPAGLYDPIRYTLAGGGKRLRPVLLLAVCDALRFDLQKAISQALGVEMFHNFTLLHDDVMDNADTRRGRPTVHRQWNTETAILSGDAMLTFATMLVAKGASMDVLDKFNRMAMDVYEGQQYDMDFEQRRNVTVDEYLNMISLKTSALISGACAIGVMMAGADQQVVDAFAAYGRNLGMAFQLQDDYLDTYGDPEKFGKAIGGDIVNDKKTWLQIMALTEDHTGETASLIAGAVPHDVKVDRMRRIYDRLELPERCHMLIDQYIRQAVDALADVDIDEDARNFFKSMARQLATRKI